MTREEYVKIVEKVKVGEWVTKVTIVFHIMTLLFMKGGSAQFFSSIRSLQLVSYTSLIHIKYPNNI